MPDFGALFLDCQGSESHLQAVEEACKGRRTCNHHVELALDSVLKSCYRENLGIKAFDGQEKNGKVGGVGDIDVLVADVLGLIKKTSFKSLSEEFDCFHITAFSGAAQLLIVLTRELGVDGKKNMLALGCSGKAYGELDRITA